MSESRSEPPDVERSRSFGGVADAYDRGRPSYPRDAAAWLIGDGTGRKDVLELGAGTGKLTEQLTDLGHRVLAAELSADMLRKLRERAAGARPVLAVAERLPVATRSVDAVVAAQAFWFDATLALPEIARALRPGGCVGLIWNDCDDRIPWVKRFKRLIGDHGEAGHDPAQVLDDSGLFQTVQRSTYRFWQPMTRPALHDVASSRSAVATLPAGEQARVHEQVDALYDECTSNRDGLLLPYCSLAYRATVLPWAATEERAVPARQADPDPLLIDFR